jgi:aminoglycoside phosphotransferase (APT) family kinase protein
MRAGDGTPPFLDALANALSAFHAFPVEEAVELLEAEPTVAAWRAGYAELWDVVEADVLPILDRPLRDAVTDAYWRFLDGPIRFTPVLTHRDLGPEHVLVDDHSGLPVGIIDFEEAGVGDPVMDLVGPARLFGLDAVEILTRNRDLGDAPLERLAFYTWTTALYHISYGVREDVPAEVEAAADALQRRFLG